MGNTLRAIFVGVRSFFYTRQPIKSKHIDVMIAVVYAAFVLAYPVLYVMPKAEAAISVRASASTNNTAITSLTINKPSGTIIGDVMVAIVGTDGGGTFTPPSGWSTVQTGVNGATLGAWYKVAGASEPSNYTFSWTSSTRGAGGITSYIGVDNLNPLGSAGSANTGSGTSVQANSITAAYSGSRIIGIFGGVAASGAGGYTPGGVASERIDASSADGSNDDVSVQLTDYDIVSPGPTGNQTSTATNSVTWAAFLFEMRASNGVRMLLFWDGGAAPAGWTDVTSTYSGKFVRGDSPTNFGCPVSQSPCGASTHTPTVASTVASGPSGTFAAANNSAPPSATSTHNHTSNNPVIGSAANSPAYCNLKLIRYDAGLPNIIPQHAITLFDNDPGIPAGWTRQSVRDGRMIRIHSSVGTSCTASEIGGSDTHSHTITWQSLGTPSAALNRGPLIFNSTTSSSTHTHTAPAATSTITNNTDPCDPPTAANECLPPYVQPLLAKANSDTPTLSVGLTGMFDGDPGGGWVIRSGGGGPFNQKFFRPAASYNVSAGQGATTHQHTSATSGVSGTNSATGGNAETLLGGTLARDGHTHTVTSTFNAASNIPEYFNVVVAEKVNFILTSYRWFENSDTNENVTDAWSMFDIAQNTAIPTIPAAYAPPDLASKLRLRIKITVNGNSLSAGVIQFKVQYKEGTDGVCTSGAWSDVDVANGSGVWRYATSTINDGADLTGSRLTSTVLQQYVKSSTPGVNPRPVTQGFSMEYDFHIENHTANGATQYSFRIIEDTGLLLSEYTVCPTLATFPRTENQLRHGNFFESGQERGFIWAN